MKSFKTRSKSPRGGKSAYDFNDNTIPLPVIQLTYYAKSKKRGNGKELIDSIDTNDRFYKVKNHVITIDRIPRDVILNCKFQIDLIDTGNGTQLTREDVLEYLNNFMDYKYSSLFFQPKVGGTNKKKQQNQNESLEVDFQLSASSPEFNIYSNCIYNNKLKTKPTFLFTLYINDIAVLQCKTNVFNPGTSARVRSDAKGKNCICLLQSYNMVEWNTYKKIFKEGDVNPNIEYTKLYNSVNDDIYNEIDELHYHHTDINNSYPNLLRQQQQQFQNFKQEQFQFLLQLKQEEEEKEQENCNFHHQQQQHQHQHQHQHQQPQHHHQQEQYFFEDQMQSDTIMEIDEILSTQQSHQEQEEERLRQMQQMYQQQYYNYIKQEQEQQEEEEHLRQIQQMYQEMLENNDQEYYQQPPQPSYQQNPYGSVKNYQTKNKIDMAEFKQNKNHSFYGVTSPRYCTFEDLSSSFNQQSQEKTANNFSPPDFDNIINYTANPFQTCDFENFLESNFNEDDEMMDYGPSTPRTHHVYFF